jgi:hypothetical protein
MHAAPGAPLWANLRTPELSYIRYGPEAEVLYDLAADPGEHVNHAADEAYADRLSHMRQRLLDRMLSAASSALSRVRPF